MLRYTVYRVAVEAGCRACGQGRPAPPVHTRSERRRRRARGRRRLLAFLAAVTLLFLLFIALGVLKPWRQAALPAPPLALASCSCGSSREASPSMSAVGGAATSGPSLAPLGASPVTAATSDAAATAPPVEPGSFSLAAAAQSAADAASLATGKEEVLRSGIDIFENGIDREQRICGASGFPGVA